jgi:NAD(P)-dependent dehydrogenase (short-subunit alcohol dehydrogenase family)
VTDRKEHEMTGILAGKVAIVTGAGRGIGRAIAEEFAAEGACVVVASRTQLTVDEAVVAITVAGGKAIGIACDMGESNQVRAMVAQAAETFGGVDILVNSAQGFGTKGHPTPANPPTPTELVTDEEWDWVFNSGLKGTLVAMQASFPHMKRRGGGSIVNFGSMRGTIATPFTAAYNAAKEAIRALSRTAANEWGEHGIRVNVINPVIETDAYRADVPTDEARQAFASTIPLRFMGQPLDAARVALFLSGPDARYLTGQTLYVDGGLVSQP